MGNRKETGMKASLKGLKNILNKFDKDGMYVCGTHWKIVNGGYDLYWQLYYDNIPVVSCILNELENDGLDKDTFKKVCAVILETYNVNTLNPIKVAAY